MSKEELLRTDTNFVLNFEITNRVTRMEEGKYQYYLFVSSTLEDLSSIFLNQSAYKYLSLKY